jgi:hypothetical protein
LEWTRTDPNFTIKPPRPAPGSACRCSFALLHAGLQVLLIRQFGQTIGQRFWKKTPCTILGSEIQERGENEEPFAFTVRYQYTYAGQSYTGSRYRRSDWTSGSYSETQRLVQKYPAGLSVFCYVNPKNPGQAVLRRDSLALGLVIPFPLIFVVIGAGGAFLIWRKPVPEAEKPIAAGALRKSKGKGKSRYAVAALFTIFAIVGGALLYPLGLKPIAKTMAAESWVATPCRVLRAEVRSHDSDDGTTYSVYILYQHEFQGQTYKSDRYEFLGGSSSGYQGKARVVDQYKTAANPVCYVNPDNPFEAVLKRGFRAKLLLVLVPLLFLLIGIGGLVPALRGKTLTNDELPKPWTAPQRAGLSHDLTTLRVTEGGRAVLTPRFSPRPSSSARRSGPFRQQHPFSLHLGPDQQPPARPPELARVAVRIPSDRHRHRSCRRRRLPRSGHVQSASDSGAEFQHHSAGWRSRVAVELLRANEPDRRSYRDAAGNRTGHVQQRDKHVHRPQHLP